MELSIPRQPTTAAPALEEEVEDSHTKELIKIIRLGNYCQRYPSETAGQRVPHSEQYSRRVSFQSELGEREREENVYCLVYLVQSTVLGEGGGNGQFSGHSIIHNVSKY